MTTKNQHLLELFMEGKSIREIHESQYPDWLTGKTTLMSIAEIEQVIRAAMRRRCGWKKK